MSSDASAPRGLLFAMATAAGVAVANIYYNQPLLGLIVRDLPGAATALVPTATQLGYAAGLFLLVPLGDRFERRGLIVAQFVGLALALVCAAIAPNALAMVAASLVVGLLAAVAQQIVPFAASLASPEHRGRTVGLVMSGLLCGILLSRTLAGLVGAHFGWRAVFWLSAPLAILMAVVMRLGLPESRPQATLGYGELMRSLGALWREFAELRTAALTQAMQFAAFSVFWTLLALRLAGQPFHAGPDVAGLFGIVGAVGVLAAPITGGLADRIGPRRVVLAGAGLCALAWVIFAVSASIPAMVVGVIVLDLAAQSSLVSNQAIVYGLRPEARSRLNTLLMGSMFLGGSAGSAIGMLAWSHGGWPLVSAAGLGFAALAGLCQITARRNIRP
jgi:predicted MFS family arabinose efflux permease